MASLMKDWLTWLKLRPQTPPALERMRLGPNDNANNPLMIQFFTWDALKEDTSWWKHLENEVPRLVELGFTQAWLPPMNKAAENVTGRGYDAYDLWDLGEFNQKGGVATRWGSKEELIRACETAKQCGLDILIDAVLNHKHGGDTTEQAQAIPSHPQNRLKDVGKRQQIESWTVFNFPGRNGKYSSFRWNQAHFTGVDYDHKSKSNNIYRLVGPGHKGWSRNVDNELGNYDFLMGNDIDHRHPDVREDFLKWGTWILETTGASGFRLDAIKHIDRKFLVNFIRSVRERSRRERLFSVAEYWSGDVRKLLPYVRMLQGEVAFFDVPLHMNLCQASQQRSRYDLRKIFDGSLCQRKPRDAVTFVDNHDTVEGQSLESWVEPAFKIQAYALILLRGVGHPCVFYGDLYPNKECYNESVARDLTLLINARQKFAYGPLQDYFHEKNCIGFVRKGDGRHAGCAVVVSNKEEDLDASVHNLRMNVGKEKAGAIYRSFMTQHGEVEIDGDGWGTFTCFANCVQVWVQAF
ncbi:hypothetical protein AGABI2DRAFT_184188 [Agaricus bisporus var. bisporus H97]|uniref:hypothetical protein n=1 Tax=Agaricus bisporus var. bisporus (strain H97 / ATCC MYA-4626 / FGSC 10389) TaxID=936046 RepID=UPI00029F65C6|nr:hypothetical protein AGABI2DRAFT_184188 [Agaricus bisporus var. bisporus H97]EKV49449.1 hypothetical protein AGABI2DRAFT_184188 [Agaricus bisporus var. bisporus H97]